MDSTFLQCFWEGGEIWAYYIKQQWSGSTFIGFGVGRARSTDGLNWIDDGFVQKVGGEFEWGFNNTQLFHQVGQQEFDGWAGNPSLDPPGYLCYGPYTTVIYPGPMDATFALMVDSNIGNDIVATIDVYDVTANQILASKDVKRSDFSASWQYEQIHLNFYVPAWNHTLEFRTFFHDVATIKHEWVGIAEGYYPHWDGYDASFPSVVKDNGEYFLVYEGSAYNNSTWAGDIGLSMSADGLNFHRHINNVILENGSGWESINIGTPSLEKFGSTWHLYYHGYNGNDCQVGVATGTDILNLNKDGLKIPVVNGTWEAGTIGKRSSLIQGPSGFYYMAYEGSTDPPYDTANWSTGLARSVDKLNWDKYSGNPVVPVVSGFGNDGPELIIINGVTYLYVRSQNGGMDRYKLVW